MLVLVGAIQPALSMLESYLSERALIMQSDHAHCFQELIHDLTVKDATVEVALVLCIKLPSS